MFSNRFFEEEVYAEQPKCCFVEGKEEKVYRLHKALYGWYRRIDKYLLGLGFGQSLSKSTLYAKHNDNEILVSPYVDGVLITWSSQKLIDEFKQDMMQAFEMTEHISLE